MISMSKYGVINIATGKVENIIEWDGSPGWTPEDGYIAEQSDIVEIGWSYVDGVFSPPPPPPVIPLTPEQIRATNEAQQADLISRASQAMAPILVSLQLGDATDDETTRAKAWQAYYRALQAVDTTIEAPAWPTMPE